MRFLALFRKELREAAPWMVLAALAMLLIGGFAVSLRMRYMGGYPQYWHENPGRQYTLYRRSELADCGPVILVASAGLGLVLAARQFLATGFLKTWAFTIHRSTSPLSILLAKAAVAAASLCLGVGAVWTGLFLWASRPGALAYQPRLEVLGEGWLMVATGMVVYFGAALSAISTARWYTTRIFGLAFAAGIVSLALVQTGLGWSVAVILIGLVILGSQVLHTLLNREF